MTEEKNTKEDKKEVVVEEKTADVKVEEKEIKKSDKKSDKKEEKIEKVEKVVKEEIVTELDLDDVEKPGKSNKAMEVEDLPEDIKKKLEKNKLERAKKKHLKKKKKKSVPRKVTIGRAYIKATYNNTVITLTDLQGNVISWASAGIAGFKGPKKATPYAAQIIAKIAILKAKEEYGLEEVSAFVRGVGTGRESAVRALNANGLNVTYIKDVTPIPHNGCRPKGPRRV